MRTGARRSGNVLVTLGVALLILVILFVSFVIGVISYGVGVQNTNVHLRNAIAAQDKQNTVIYDNMWKIIQEKAGVSGEYADKFKEIYPDLIAGRYKTGGGLMKWVQEQNPNFDTSLYKDLMVSIESERHKAEQGFAKVLDLKREHDTLIDSPISGFVVGLWGDTTKTNPTIVTSSRTEGAFATGMDDQTLTFNRASTAAKPPEPAASK